MTLHAFTEASPAIQLHVLCAVAALGLGAVQFLAVKGTLMHRTVGAVWMALMAVVAVSAIFIRVINPGHFSLLHLLVPLTLFGLVGLVRSIWRHNYRSHRRIVTILFFGALVVPGVLTFLPGRLMHTVFLAGLSG